MLLSFLLIRYYLTRLKIQKRITAPIPTASEWVIMLLSRQKINKKGELRICKFSPITFLMPKKRYIQGHERQKSFLSLSLSTFHPLPENKDSCLPAIALPLHCPKLLYYIFYFLTAKQVYVLVYVFLFAFSFVLHYKPWMFQRNDLLEKAGLLV